MAAPFKKLTAHPKVNKNAPFILPIIQYILWLDVSVADMSFMNVLDGFNDLINDFFQFLSLVSQLPLHSGFANRPSSDKASSPSLKGMFPSPRRNRRPDIWECWDGRAKLYWRSSVSNNSRTHYRRVLPWGRRAFLFLCESTPWRNRELPRLFSYPLGTWLQTLFGFGIWTLFWLLIHWVRQNLCHLILIFFLRLFIPI